ncbi:MAG: ABC transporter permease [Lachnospiraceae bacterium]|nr:ABC transporter permease [Lachnospiraceae bacterium]
MKTANRFIALTKRILCRKMYISILLTMVLLTGIYKLLPAKSQSADIKVAMFSEDSTGYYDSLVSYLGDINSIYTFYTVDTEEQLLKDVKSGYAECGYLIPDGFFQAYVAGTAWDNPVSLYVTPASTFHAVINETFFSAMVSVCAEDILLYAVDNPTWNQELKDGLDFYRNSPEVFTIADTTSGEFTFENMMYHIDLPMVEIVSVLLLFSGLLGLLLFLHDSEKNIYVALPNSEILQVRTLSILTSIIPVAIIGIICLYVTFGFGLYVIFSLVAAVISFVIAMLLGIIIRKSTLLEKVLPLIMLTALIAVFLKTII